MKTWFYVLVTVGICLGLSMAFLGCYKTTQPPPCTNIETCEDPTRAPPAVELPKDPLAPPGTPFYSRHDGGTDGR